MGQQLLTPKELARAYKGTSSLAYKFAKWWNKELDIEISYLKKAAKHLKKCADKKRQPHEFSVGDEVMVKFP